MIWSSIKAAAFVGLATATGIAAATVPLGGKTIADRVRNTHLPAGIKHVGAEGAPKIRHDVAVVEPVAPAPTPGAGPQHTADVDPHQVATVIPDAAPADAYRQSERDAISHLIQQKARKGEAIRHQAKADQNPASP